MWWKDKVLDVCFGGLDNESCVLCRDKKVWKKCYHNFELGCKHSVKLWCLMWDGKCFGFTNKMTYISWKNKHEINDDEIGDRNYGSWENNYLSSSDRVFLFLFFSNWINKVILHLFKKDFQRLGSPDQSLLNEKKIIIILCY